MATHLRPEGIEVIEQDHPCDKGKLECFLNEQEIMAIFVLLSWEVLKRNLNFQLRRFFLLSPDLWRVRTCLPAPFLCGLGHQ